MKIIYLGAYKAHHPNWDMVYQDINGKRDIGGDMLDIDLSAYDIIIATPPCNYYSRNLSYERKKTSEYALKTRHLLPDILKKLSSQNKPFIVENVRSYKMFDKLGLFNLPVFVYFIGRHTYWTNIAFNPSNIEQSFDFKAGISRKDNNGLGGRTIRLKKNSEGGTNVHNVIEWWLKVATA